MNEAIGSHQDIGELIITACPSLPLELTTDPLFHIGTYKTTGIARFFPEFSSSARTWLDLRCHSRHLCEARYID
ncbi:hypothetical protein KIN20_009079 [Parelaphostrongylus tenuis]|uniref:Uncharacterized protein n=1 Tax=Parelaphostrongylus tenuis TaxID=148309 RepID=A0AAD5QI11_PARTN|nr:hypothetical protein KIN20_009079 [Parelaphostrongylus tenuis]